MSPRRTSCTFGEQPGSIPDHPLADFISAAILLPLTVRTFPSYTRLNYPYAQEKVALAQWGKGLAVLLEKIFGNVFVTKLRAICLLEADINWWSKLIFAKRTN
jgi:hypothetical protein